MPKRSRDPEATRAALLAAAEPLFAERGYAGASTEEISRLSKVNKAMISYHFGGKRGLYTAVLSRNLDASLDRIKALAGDRRPAPERLRDFIRIFSAVHRERPLLSQVLLRELMSGGAHVDDEEMLPRILAIFSVLAGILADGGRERHFRKIAPLPAHIGLMGSLIFAHATRAFRERLLTSGKLPTRSFTDEEFAQYVEELTIRGLRPDPAVVNCDRPQAPARRGRVKREDS